MKLVDAVPAPTAVVRTRTTRAEFKPLIRALFDKVYSSGVKLRGHNVIVYRRGEGDALDMEVGVLLDAPVALAGELVAGETPGGRAITAVHCGPYERIGETYDAISAWAETQGVRLGGTFWEVYGDWNEDPAKLETQVYHGVA